MEHKIEERSYFNENWIKADKSISEYPIGTKFKLARRILDKERKRI